MDKKREIFSMNNKPAANRIFTRAGKSALVEREKFVFDNAYTVLEFIEKYEPSGVDVRIAISRDKGEDTIEIVWRLLDKGYIEITPMRHFKITDLGREML